MLGPGGRNRILFVIYYFLIFFYVEMLVLIKHQHPGYPRNGGKAMHGEDGRKKERKKKKCVNNGHLRLLSHPHVSRKPPGPTLLIMFHTTIVVQNINQSMHFSHTL